MLLDRFSSITDIHAIVTLQLQPSSIAYVPSLLIATPYQTLETRNQPRHKAHYSLKRKNANSILNPLLRETPQFVKEKEPAHARN